MSVIEIVSLSLDAKVKAALEEQRLMVMEGLRTAINQPSGKPSD
jgi:hypothetical protein